MDAIATAAAAAGRAALSPPADSRLRAAEHIAVLLAAGCAAVGAWRLGPAGAYKAVVGALFSGLSAVPGVSSLVDIALADELATIERELLGDGDPDAHSAIPLAGARSLALTVGETVILMTPPVIIPIETPNKRTGGAIK